MRTARRPVGIIAMGSFLPDAIRTNDWWPKETVESWRKRGENKVVRAAPAVVEEQTPAVRRILAILESLRADPFQGARERRVAPEEVSASDMEIEAGKSALAAAGISRDQVDVLLTTSTTPDFLGVPNACRVHHGLGLPNRCFVSTLEAMCNGFLTQLSLAEPMIATGQARYALLIQSSLMSRICLPEDQQSGWYGDGATAVLLGPVSEGRGVLGSAHKTDGTMFGGVVCGVPGKRWYDEGRARAYTKDPALARRMVLGTGDVGREVFDAALQEAGVGRRDISFYSSHQAWIWFRPLTQQVLEIDQARYADTFTRYASLLGCNIPISLIEGERAGKLRAGDVVATHSGAAGLTATSVILRWGT